MGSPNRSSPAAEGGKTSPAAEAGSTRAWLSPRATW